MRARAGRRTLREDVANLVNRLVGDKARYASGTHQVQVRKAGPAGMIGGRS